LSPVLVVIVVTAAGVGALLLDRPAPAPISGLAQAVDGDTLRLGVRRIRLTGLDAPELGQTCTDRAGHAWACGAEAKAFVAGVLAQGPVECVPAGRDAYGRTLAACTIDGGDLGAKIVSAGWAVADFGYLAEQATAHAAGRGIWDGSFIAPADWRRTHSGAEPDFWQWIRSWFQ
jgi:endonuclease YncB( thermonuclease family)